jgi:hypothetical protein
MTSLYFDSTYLCKLHWPEPGAAEVVACAAGADELVVALHGEAEFYSAGHRKLREGVVSPEALSAVFAQFQADYAGGGIRFLQITEAIVHRVFEVYSSAPVRRISARPMPFTLRLRPSTASPKFTPTTDIFSPQLLFLGCAE